MLLRIVIICTITARITQSRTWVARTISGAVVEHYYRELVSFLSARLGNRQAAEDVAHDAYLRVLERTGGGQIEHPRAFLYRTALNLVIDRHRRHQVRQAESLDALDAEGRLLD